MPELIKVGMADLKAGKAPDSIISYGLGSCVGIALYDPQTGAFSQIAVNRTL